MSYRVNGAPPPIKNRTVQKTVTPITFYMTNGATADIAFPCWYHEVPYPQRAIPHSQQWHDHVGWPSPNHRDHICQHWDFSSHVCGHHGHHECRHCADYINMEHIYPIHLTEEGYEKVEILVSEQVDGIVGKGWIDEKEDWVVRCHFSGSTTKALEEPFVFHFAVTVNCAELNKTDTVVLGRLVVMPAPLTKLKES